MADIFANPRVLAYWQKGVEYELLLWSPTGYLGLLPAMRHNKPLKLTSAADGRPQLNGKALSQK